MGSTTIEWTEVTWNPVRGCSRVSEGCRHCYAEIMAGRFSKPGLWGHGFAQQTAAGHRWTGEVALIPEKLAEPLSWKAPRMCFVNSTSDLFHEKLSNEDIAAVYGVMAACPHITFQVLTKRPERRLEWFAWVRRREEHGRSIFPHDSSEWRIWQMLHVSASRRGASLKPHHGGAWPLSNVWEGTSVENRAVFSRIDHLRETPAAVRFLSLEPLLEDLETIDLSGIGWVIVGGESGPGAREFDLCWARDIVAQCKQAGVPVFVKQMGSNPVDPWADTGALVMDREPARPKFKSKKGGDMSEWPEDLQLREIPEVKRG